MKVDCKKTYGFSLNAINDCKKEKICSKAKVIRDIKNKTSLWVCNNFLQFVLMTKFDFLKNFNNDSIILSGQDFQHAIGDVYVSYENKMAKFKEKMSFKVQDELKIERYKVNGKAFRKDQVRSIELKMKYTTLTKVLTFMSKYWSETTLTYIKTQLESSEVLDDKRLFYTDVLKYVDKFGVRLINLALLRRQNVLNMLVKHPIKFTSLTFNSLNQISHPLITYNKNRTSNLNVFVSLGAFGEDKDTLIIPSKHSRNHHGDLKKYQKGKNTSYTIVFRGNDPVRVSTSIDAEDNIENDKTEAIGADVNVKHNLFFLSDGSSIDYDRELFTDYVKFLKKMDQKIQRGKDRLLGKPPELSNRDARFVKNWRERIKDMLKKECSRLVQKIKGQGKDHLIIEDLGQFSKSFCRSDELEGFKYSRLVRLLGLADLKNILESICNKNEVQLTIVHAHYTSQTCPKCGFISRENRKSQENFKCINCGHEANADHNSAINILHRFQSDVLRGELLSKDLNGLYRPRRLKKEAIKRSIENSFITTRNQDQQDDFIILY